MVKIGTKKARHQLHRKIFYFCASCNLFLSPALCLFHYTDCVICCCRSFVYGRFNLLYFSIATVGDVYTHKIRQHIIIIIISSSIGSTSRCAFCFWLCRFCSSCWTYLWMNANQFRNYGIFGSSLLLIFQTKAISNIVMSEKRWKAVSHISINI